MKIGFWDVLLIVFITLKVLGLIKWSWWLVFTPLWLSLAGALIVFLLLCGMKLVTKRRKNDYKKIV